MRQFKELEKMQDDEKQSSKKSKRQKPENGDASVKRIRVEEIAPETSSSIKDSVVSEMMKGPLITTPRYKRLMSVYFERIID